MYCTSEFLVVRRMRRKGRIREKGWRSAFPLRWPSPMVTVGLWGTPKALLIRKQGLWGSCNTAFSSLIAHERWRRSTKAFFFSLVC